MAAAKRKKRIWFRSPLFILILAFIIVTSLGLWLYGANIVMHIMLKYAIGATATAIFIAILGFIFRKQLVKLIRKVVR